MNIASALIKQVLELQDFQTWSVTHKHYLPAEYHSLHKIIDKHCEQFHKMPTIEDLKFEIRDSGTREKLFAIEAVEVDADPEMLLQYLKNEFTQKEILNSLEDYVEHSVAFEDAQESVNHLHPIVLDIEDKVEDMDMAERAASYIEQLNERHREPVDFDGHYLYAPTHNGDSLE